jgi:hypothetical protein
MITLRAFRAVDDYETCQKFMLGHRSVLENIGVHKLSSAKDEWMVSPGVFVIIVESQDKTKVYGGARVHVADGVLQLPIEEATGYLDSNIYSIVKEHATHGTGEICGLWNSREVAGMGIGSVFLTRACVIISSQICLQSLFALCAPYTIKMAQMVGYHIMEEIGNKGTFYYPKLDLLATSMLLDDVNTLRLADPAERNKIFSLRKNPNQLRTEILRDKEIVLDYHLEIPKLDDWYSSGIIKNLIKDE